MTFRERLQIDHPERVDEIWTGGCYACPLGNGYEDKIPAGCSGGADENDCIKCWDREMLETISTEAIDSNKESMRMIGKGKIKMIDLTKEQCKSLVELIEEYLFEIIRNDKDIDNIQWLVNIADAYKALKEKAENNEDE